MTAPTLIEAATWRYFPRLEAQRARKEGGWLLAPLVAGQSSSPSGSSLPFSPSFSCVLFSTALTYLLALTDERNHFLPSLVSLFMAITKKGREDKDH